MKIELKDLSKRYTHTWVLKKINYVFGSSGIYGITGLNGSGKSTLMQIISSHLSPTLGTIKYSDAEDREINKDAVYSRISFSAPYISPLDNLNLDESISFHTTFRKFKSDIGPNGFKELLEFSFKEDQYVKYYSSGMKKRLSLALSILTVSDLILLDEPGSYLDEQGKKWFHALLKKYKEESTVIISSNEKEDLKSCRQFLSLSQ